MSREKIIRITTVPLSFRFLLRGQLQFMKEYYDVLAIASNDQDYDIMVEEQGVRGYSVKMTRQITPLADIRALFNLIRILHKERPLIVHTHTPKAGLLGMVAAWITRVPVRLHTVAGLPLLVATGKKRLLLRFVERITYACATNVYPNSFVMRQIILNNKLTKAQKVKVIANGSSNGIDTSFFSRKALFDRIERKSTGFTFCFVGRLVRDKGINELINAFCRLYCENKELCLLLVGSFEKELDPVLPKVEETILHHPAIHFMGWQKDIRPFLEISDALVFPSYREGFPNVVMQAGAMELPSIVTDINGCNEIIIPNENGVIIQPQNEESLYNAMKYFVEQPERIENMAAKARKLITSRYEQKNVWEALRKEYQDLIEKYELQL